MTYEELCKASAKAAEAAIEAEATYEELCKASAKAAEAAIEAEAMEKAKKEAKNARARARAKARRDVYESLGMKRGRDSMGRVMYD